MAPELPSPRLSDGVVSLREVEETDAEAFSEAALGTDVPELAYANRLEFTLEQTRDYIGTVRARREAADAIVLAVTDARDGRFLGITMLFAFDRNNLRAEIGFWAAAAARGSGAATRAVELTTRWAFGELGLGRVYGDTNTDNLAAQRLFERAGYTREGVLRGNALVGERRVDQVRYGRLASDRAAARQK